MTKVSCIIPAYNEEERIATVLRAVYDHPFIHEIVVVDDASHDKTAVVVKQFTNVILITNSKNQGKSASLAIGLRVIQSEFVLLLDADLLGITEDAVTDLITPVLSGKADISISLRNNAPRTWHLLGIDYISGERVFRLDLIANHLKVISHLPGFGFEVFLNDIIIKNKLRVAIVPWPTVISPFKFRKMGIVRGIIADIKMLTQILYTVSAIHLVRQIIGMRKLRIHI